MLDVADPAHPLTVETTKLDGTYDDSRLIGDRLYVVVNNDTWVPAPEPLPIEDPVPVDPTPTPTPTPPPGSVLTAVANPPVLTADAGGAASSGASSSATVYESEAAYRARLAAMPLTDLLPSYTSEAGGTTTSGLLVQAPDAYVRDLADPTVGQNLTTIALLNVGDDAGGTTATSTVAGYGGTVYASPRPCT